MPSVIQNENHIYYQNHRLKEYIKRYNIVLTSWYPLGGRGYITDHLHNEMIVNMSNTYKKTPAQIILRWQLQSGNISVPGLLICYIFDRIMIFLILNYHQKI